MFGISIVLDLCCYKWRHLAKSFFYFEMLAWMTRALVPETNCVNYAQSHMILACLNVMCFFCDLRLSLVILVLTTAGSTYFQILWHEGEENDRLIGSFFLSIVVISTVTLVLTKAILYVTNLQKRLRQQMNEYLNLVNRMREGVIVLTKDLKGALEI